MVYRLDAMEAYNKHLVKKIAVTGITATGSTATESYVYLESINLSGLLSRDSICMTIQANWKNTEIIMLSSSLTAEMTILSF